MSPIRSTPCTARHLRYAGLLWPVILLLAASSGPARGAEPIPGNSLGIELDLARGRESATAAGALAAGEPGASGEEELLPLVLRIRARWDRVQPEPDRMEWEDLDRIVEAAGNADRLIVLTLYGSNDRMLAPGEKLGPDSEEAVERWTLFLREVAGRYRGRIQHYQIGRAVDEEGDGGETAARDYAYLFKRSAVALKSVDPGIRVALGSLRSTSSAFADALFRQEVAVYADALAVAYSGGGEGLAQMRGVLLLHDPSAQLWIEGVRLLVGMEGYGQFLRAYVKALEAEASLITFEDPPDQTGKPFHLDSIRRVRDLFTPDYGPLVEGGRGVRAVDGSGAPLSGALTARFFSPEEKRVLMPYDGGAGGGTYGVYILDGVDLAGPVLHDVAAGESSSSVTIQKDEENSLSRLALPVTSYPLVLSYRRFTTPEYAIEDEQLDVTGEKIPSAEEIIARYQAVQEAQDALLQNLQAQAEETWHFSAGTGGSFDVTFVENFYFDPEVGAEWEQKELLVNGVRWRTNTIPELPFILPEKAASLPLDISLSKEYIYEYKGVDKVDGRECFLIEFRPVEKGRKLSSGKVWIETDSYARVRVAQVQDDQPAPVVSNDQRDTYAPIIGPDGFTYWVLSRIDSQQIYSTGGRTFVINKDTVLHDYILNSPTFRENVRDAHASSHTILRDTDKGLKYLARGPGGERTVKEEASTRNLFAVGGVFYNESLRGPVPLAGINYFNSDFLDRGLQANLFFAGALLFGNLSDPSLFGTRMDASLDLFGTVLAGSDRMVRENPRTGVATERDGEAIATRTQSLTGGVGLPFGGFFKVRAEGQLYQTDYSEVRNETCDPIVLPEDTFVRSGTLIGEFNRRAWSASFQHTWAERARHDPWGLGVSTDPSCPRGAGNLTHPDYFPEAENFVQFGGALAKEFYLPFHQKIRVRGSAWGSRDVDRFSKYKFGFFGNRLRGFSGAGIHYTDGALYHGAYAFNLADVIRFEAAVDHANVRDRQLGEDFRRFTGAGLTIQMAGPWNLFFRLEWGRAIASDIPEFEGEQELLFTVLKLFSQR